MIDHVFLQYLVSRGAFRQEADFVGSCSTRNKALHEFLGMHCETCPFSMMYSLHRATIFTVVKLTKAFKVQWQ